MKRFEDMLYKVFQTIWPGLICLMMNLTLTVANLIHGGVGDFTLLSNAFGIVFSLDIIYTWHKAKKERERKLKLFKLTEQDIHAIINEILERDRKTRSDESNSDKP